MLTNQLIIEQTQHWIHSFVIKLNLCPFAKREMDRNSVRIQPSHAASTDEAMIDFKQEIELLNTSPSIETILVVYASFLNDFFDYLDFVDKATKFLDKAGYEGIYQLATFHPDYCFADTSSTDVTNYTNRSPYPMLHLLREESIEKAIFFYGDTDEIPNNNMKLLRDLGLDAVKKILA